MTFLEELLKVHIMLRPFAAHAQLFYLETHTVSTKPFEVATCSDGLCVQLYNSTTYSKKEKNTKNSVIFTPTLLFFSKKKCIHFRQPLNFHQWNQALKVSFDVFYTITLRYLHIHMLSTTNLENSMLQSRAMMS